MSIEQFYTSQAHTKTPASAPITVTVSQKTGDPKHDFLRLIVEQILPKQEVQPNVSSGAGTDETLAEITEPGNIDIVEILAANPELQQKVEAYGLSLEDTLALNQHIFDNILVELPEGLDQAELMKQIQAVLQKLDLGKTTETGELILENLTPAEIANLQKSKTGQNAAAFDANDVQQFADLMTEETGLELSEELINYLTAVINIVPTQSQEFIVIPQSFAVSGTAAVLPANDMGARLNKINNLATPQDLSEILTLEDGMTFGDFLKQLSLGQKNEGMAQFLDGNSSKPQNALLTSADNGSTLIGWPFTLEGSLFSSPLWTESWEQQMGLTSAQNSQMTLASLTSLSTQASQAGQPHPATQMVAVNLQKAAAKGGDNQNFLLQLEPPELGRVEVQMTINKDKTVKAVMTVEKPETMLMLQRDAHILERALQDAGLDSEGLSFELAQENHDFSQDNRRGGGHDSGGTGAGDSEEAELELIESTMTWYVDPETGHTRYDILV